MLNKIVHHSGQHVRHLLDTCSVGSWSGVAGHYLPGCFGLLDPLARDRIYDVQHTELMCRGAVLQLLEDLLDDGRVGLKVGGRT